MRQLQQGDVLLNQIKTLPKDAKQLKPKDKRYILADGEVTGHAHAIEALESIELYEVNDTLYLKVISPAPLIHEEHNTINLPVGLYEVGRVVEIDPFEQELRNVRD